MIQFHLICNILANMYEKKSFKCKCTICLAGNTGCYPDSLDPELTSALQNVSEVVCRFVDNNPTAWAPLICQVCTCYLNTFHHLSLY